MIQKSKSVSPMSNEGRNAYVIEHINEALFGLLKEKSLNEISISEICETAGVGRMSFYRNYENKEDVIKKQLLQRIMRVKMTQPIFPKAYCDITISTKTFICFFTIRAYPICFSKHSEFQSNSRKRITIWKDTQNQ